MVVSELQRSEYGYINVTLRSTNRAYDDAEYRFTVSAREADQYPIGKQFDASLEPTVVPHVAPL
jgi:hypothetical protein